jgi:hypothetical protein
MSSDLVLRILYCYQMYYLFYNYCRVCTISNSFFVKCIYFISPNLLHKTIMLFNNQTVFYVRNYLYIYYNVMIVPIVNWLIIKISLHVLIIIKISLHLLIIMKISLHLLIIIKISLHLLPNVKKIPNYQLSCYFFSLNSQLKIHFTRNRIGAVMVSVLGTSVIDRGFTSVIRSSVHKCD